MSPRYLLSPRRAQTRIESLMVLAMFAIAGVGAWKLYGPQIAATGKRLLHILRELLGGG